MTNEAQKKKPGLFGRLFGSKTDAPDTSVPDADLVAREEAQILPEDERGALDAPEPLQSSPPADAPTPAAVITVRDMEPTDSPKSWFQRLKSGLTRTSSKLTDGITGLFTKRKLDGATLEDLEDLLIQADLGVETSGRIIDRISKGRFEKGISADEVREILASEVETVLGPVAKPLTVSSTNRPHVILVVGVNGGGKTTTIGKLAARFKGEGKSVLLAAGDTFRAAAIDQLKVWGERTGCDVVSSVVGSDASGLAFEALKRAQDSAVDVLIIDTAGRLQNKQALMEELEKVTRVLKKIDAEAPHDVLLVLDATTGQNALQQVEIFGKRAGVTGLVMTKLDGTARGGILVAIAAKYKIPIHAIGVGESVDDLQSFQARDFANAIAGS
ncbi:MAG: signal recognition particle-docking protein FtsY [Hyphomicrobium sp.]|nr:signal recognition particle-docking protein FtsY [Hyphomicrobium sp.]